MKEDKGVGGEAESRHCRKDALVRERDRDDGVGTRTFCLFGCVVLVVRGYAGALDMAAEWDKEARSCGCAGRAVESAVGKAGAGDG